MLEKSPVLMGISSALLRRNVVRILTNELKSAKLLRRAGFSLKKSEAIMAMMTGVEIHNLYSSEEIDIMLSEAVDKVFVENRREFDEKIKEHRRESDEKIKEQRREFDAMFNLIQSESRESRKEHRADFASRFSQFQEENIESRKNQLNEIITSRRWLIGTIVTVGMGLAAYLSALIKLSH